MKKGILEMLVTATALGFGIFWGYPLLNGYFSALAAVNIFFFLAVVIFFVHALLEYVLDITDPMGIEAFLFLAVVFILGVVIINKLWLLAGFMLAGLVFTAFLMRANKL